MGYVELRESAAYNYGNDTGRILEVIAQRFIGANPKLPYTYTVYNPNGIITNKDGRFDIELTDRVDAQIGEYALVAGTYYCDRDYSMNIYLNYKSPGRIYVNGALWDSSDGNDELMADHYKFKDMFFKKGMNQIVIELEKTPIGFGLVLGSENAKYHFLNIRSPFEERCDRGGFVYSNAYKVKINEETLPDLLGKEKASGYKWLPQKEWTVAQKAKKPFERIFGKGKGYLYAWTKAQKATELKITSKDKVFVYNNGENCYSASGTGKVKLQRGDVLVATCDESAKLEIKDAVCPVNVTGYDGIWLYLGRTTELLADICDINSVVAPSASCDNLADYLYWQVDLPGMWVRPYVIDEKLYGSWSYPLGVTLYGILKAGRLTDNQGFVKYVKDHIQLVADTYRYAKWDRIKYNFPGLHQKLATMTMLDDCGSMGSTALEAGVTGEYADDTANFIRNELEKLDDGAFYRICKGKYSSNTMWADDLYMSTPFLTRYTSVSGDNWYIDEAAKQFMLFKKYLFMEDEGIMAHVFAFDYGMKNNIPWGRGNGWVIFSLSELLEFMPQTHKMRKQLLEFFNTLCENYLRLQDESGMWHQVINDEDAYLEASCTAMFTYAFSRGVRFGWLKNSSKYAQAAIKGWDALKRDCIDKEGNVYGVCHGSRFSFSKDYYKYDLKTKLNDTHGIGIIMLAGAECENMKNNF